MTRLRLLAVLAVVVPFGLLTASPASAVARAQAKQPIEVVVTSNPVKLVSSTGQKLYFEIEAEADTFHGELAGAEGYVFVSDKAGEQHSWDWYNLANGDLSYDATSGTGTFLTDTQLGSWGSFDLNIAPQAAKPKATCAGGDQDWAVTLSGTAWFNSHSVWGAFGSPQAPLTVSQAGDADASFTHKALNGCGEPENEHCNGTVSWDDSGGVHGVLDGNSVGRNGKRGSQFFFVHSHSIGDGNGPERDDIVFINTAEPLKVVTKATGKGKGKKTRVTVHVHGGKHGLITGSATLTSLGRPTVFKHLCQGGATNQWNAKYTPGANPLTIHMAIGGDFSHPAVKNGADLSIESG
jgi:hypothetical protein